MLHVSVCASVDLPARMARIPPMKAILAFDWSVAEPILMHLTPSRATTMEQRPSSREMIIRARHTCT